MKKYLFLLSFIFVVILSCTLAYADGNHDHSGDKIKKLLTQPLTLQFAVIALVISFILGGLHALTPGHGKAVVAAYLVGTKGRIIDAIALGLIVTFTHTFSVISIGLILLFAKDKFAQEDIVLWLSLISGLLIVCIGGWLLVKNMKRYFTSKSNPLEHSHDHTHGHTHSHTHANGHTHSHVPSERVGLFGLLSLGISGGIVPCVDALIGLLFAISIDKLTWGVVILCAFSLGLAAVLVAIGILMVMAKPIIERFTGKGIWLQRLPIISATVVIVLGALLVFKALNQVGIQI